MTYLAVKLKTKNSNKNYPFVRGNINSKNIKDKFHIAFIFPLAFLKLIKLLPNSLNIKIIKKIGLDIEMTKLVDLFLTYCAGTSIEITSSDADIYFEIK